MSKVIEKTLSTDSPPTSLHEKAEDNLRFIRASMQGASEFTGVSGKGFGIAGSSALVAAWIAEQQATDTRWSLGWMIELLFAGSASLILTAHKANQQGSSLWSTNGKKLLFAFMPTMSVGAVLTLSLFLQGNISWLPGIWLSLYGASVMTAGAYSVEIIPVMGALFLLLGAMVLLTPVPANLVLGIGMGGFHIVFGIFVWRNYGG
jgi:hypothetical protein